MILQVADIGSNAVKVSCFAAEGGGFRLVSSSRLALSLGRQVFGAGAIEEDAAGRIAAFVRKRPANLPAAEAWHVLAVATAAVRAAANRERFVRDLERRLDCEVKVLSGEAEGYLIHLGMIARAEAGPDERIATIDIGGGSVEMGWSRGRRFLMGRSLELGAIRLAQEFAGETRFTRDVAGRIRGRALESLTRAFGSSPPEAVQRALAGSGNIRAVDRMVRCVRGGPFLRIVPELTRGSLEDVVEAALGHTPEGLRRLFRLDAERAGIVMPAVVVLHTAMQYLDLPRLAVTEAGLREGVAHYWLEHGRLDPMPGVGISRDPT